MWELQKGVPVGDRGRVLGSTGYPGAGGDGVGTPSAVRRTSGAFSSPGTLSKRPGIVAVSGRERHVLPVLIRGYNASWESLRELRDMNQDQEVPAAVTDSRLVSWGKLHASFPF